MFRFSNPTYISEYDLDPSDLLSLEWMELPDALPLLSPYACSLLAVVRIVRDVVRWRLVRTGNNSERW